MKKLLGVLGFVFVATVATPSSAADSAGKKGQLVSLQINAPGSDEFSNYRGAAEIKVWPKKGSPKTKRYMWGGSNCPNRDLDFEQIQLLSIALTQNMNVLPKYKPGQLPNSRCLVSFKLFRPFTGGGGGGNKDKDKDKDKDKGKGKGKGKDGKRRRR